MRNHNYICEKCGAFLDAGECCDCEEQEKEIKAKWSARLITDSRGQLTFKEAKRNAG